MNDEINNEELRKFIYKTHYKTFNKIYPLVKKMIGLKTLTLMM